MVDWLLQNSLGPMWLAMCKKHGWTPEVEADGTLDAAGRAAGRVAGQARRGRGRAHRPDAAPHRRRAPLGVLRAAADPRRRGRARAGERARPEAPRPGGRLGALPGRGASICWWRSTARKPGIAARRARSAGPTGRSSSASSSTTSTASTSTRGRCRSRRRRSGSRRSRPAPEARARAAEPGRLEPAAREPGRRRPGAGRAAPRGRARDGHSRRSSPTRSSTPCAGADHLGSLLKIDAAVDEAIRAARGGVRAGEPACRATSSAARLAAQQRLTLDRDAARGDAARPAGGLSRAAHQRAMTSACGCAASSSRRACGSCGWCGRGRTTWWWRTRRTRARRRWRTRSTSQKTYPLGKADLYAAFLLRGLELVREGGVSAMLTMRNWMFIKQYADLREHLLETFDLRALGDFDRRGVRGGAERRRERRGQRVRASSAPARGRVWRCSRRRRDDTSHDRERTAAQAGRDPLPRGSPRFDPAALKVVPEWPLVYWWDEEFCSVYERSTSSATSPGPSRGLTTGDNARFLRRPWEVRDRYDLHELSRSARCTGMGAIYEGRDRA